MAPDLNSVPESPRNRDRATSSAMNANVGGGPGPLRHPRPLTAAELYLELEKEQEGIVNRLTRELSALRAQTASVASTTSSTSELLEHSIIVPTSARRHRSSSNVSTRSNRSINAATTTGTTSVSGVAAPRETSVPNSSRPSIDLSRPDISRQNSVVGRRSVTASPSLSSIPFSSQGYSAPTQRQATTAQTGGSNSAGDVYTQHPRSPSFSAAVAAARYEEAAFARAELDAVRKENEALRQRIKDLEKDLGKGGPGGGGEGVVRK